MIQNRQKNNYNCGNLSNMGVTHQGIYKTTQFVKEKKRKKDLSKMRASSDTDTKLIKDSKNTSG